MQSMELQDFHPIGLEGVKYQPGDVIQALNYGDEPLFSRLTSAWNSREDIRNMSCIWDISLIDELFARLYGSDRRDFVRSHGFAYQLRLRDDEFLLGLLRIYYEQPRDKSAATIIVPHSHAVVDLDEFVLYLRNSVKMQFSGEADSTRIPEEFVRKQRELWEKLKGTCFQLAMLNITIAGTVLTNDRTLNQHAFFALRRAFLGSEPVDHRSSDKEVMWQLSSTTLVKDLRIQATGKQPNREKFLDIVGIRESETRMRDDLFGQLDELKASNLLVGPFGIQLTRNPWEHLTFSQSPSGPKVRILDLKSLFLLYIPQRTGIAT
jgi:hypothetical protein